MVHCSLESYLIDAETGQLANSSRTLLSTLISQFYNALVRKTGQTVERSGQDTFKLTDDQKQIIDECLNYYPKHLYHQSEVYQVHKKLRDPDDDSVYRVHSALEVASRGVIHITSGYGGNALIPIEVSYPGVINYLIELGAGIGLTYFPSTCSVHNTILHAPYYPAQLFIGAKKSVVNYLKNHGYYQSSIFSLGDLRNRLDQDNIEEKDKVRLIEQAKRAKNSGYFEENLVNVLLCVIGLLKIDDHTMFEEDRILSAYIKYHNALIDSLYQKNEHALGISLLQSIIEQAENFTASEFETLRDKTKQINDPCFSPRLK